MAIGAGLAGAPSWGTGISRALSLAGPASQLDIQQGRQTATLTWLQNKGYTPDEAKTLISNPTMLAQVAPQLLGAKQAQFTQIGEDMLGNKKFGFVDPVRRTVTDLAGNPITAGSGGGTMIPTGSDGNPLSGQALLQHLEKTDPVTAAGIKGLISGDLNAGGRNLQKLAPIAQLVDPSFSMMEFPKRVAALKNYTSGKQFQELQALNTVAGHLDDLSKAADKLDNTSFPLINQAKNFFAQNTGHPEVDVFNTTKQAVTNELSKAYRGGHVTEGDVHEWQSNISAAKSPEQLRAVVGKMNDLLMSKRQALEDGYRSSMGQAPLPSEFSAVSDHAREVFNRVADWSHGTKTAPTAAPIGAGSPAAPAAATVPVAVNPKTGQRITLRNGQWVDAATGAPVQ
jgi:hypothetical protein